MQLNLTRRNVLVAALAGAALKGVQAADKPPLRVIVPNSAGSGIDTHIRAVTVSLTKALDGQPIVVENITGAGGIPGTAMIVKAPPDGNTLGFVSNNHAVNPSVYKKMPFDSLEDITPICVVGKTPFVLVVNPKLPAKSIKELQALLKSKPDGYNYASSGNGTIIHLAGAQFLEAAGAEARHIPYKGMNAMVTDIIAGNVEFGVISVPVAQPHVKSGALRALGILGKQRLESMPGVPSMAEQGFPTVDIGGWFAFIGPAKMQPAEVKRLNAAIIAAFAMPEAMEAMTRQENIISPMSPADSARYFKTEQERYAQLAKKAGVTLD